MSEEWRWVPGYESRYSVSSLGRVATHRKTGARLMSPSRGTPYGHRKVALAGKGHWVHRLVLRAFVGEPSDGQMARHLDGDPENNRLTNLAWGTSQQNDADRAKHGTAKGELNPKALLSEEQVLDIYRSRHRGAAPALAAKYGCTVWAIYSIWRGDNWGWLTGA